MHALLRFAHIAAANTFTTSEIYPHTLKALGSTSAEYSLASLRYDLYKLRAKALVHKLPRSRRYQLSPQGYSICLILLKLFERVYAPLTAGLLHPLPGDLKLPHGLIHRRYDRNVGMLLFDAASVSAEFRPFGQLWSLPGLVDRGGVGKGKENHDAQEPGTVCTGISAANTGVGARA